MGRRAVVIVLDGLGAGKAPDAADFGDEGANTLSNTAKATGGIEAPNLQALGLGNVEEIQGISRHLLSRSFPRPDGRAISGKGNPRRTLGDDGPRAR